MSLHILRGHHVSDDVLQESSGSVVADRVIDDIAAGATNDLAWLRLVELASRHGWRSVAARAFVSTLAKRASS